jgi:cysteine sulfinate desulfinase/cysteine desulfurase-like protein
MARTYSEKLLISVQKSDDVETGVKLAKACIEAKLPAQYVAEAIGVSRMTVHSWFRGSPIRHKNAKTIKALLKIIEDSMADGSLPATSMQYAKEYASDARIKLNTVEQ